MIHIPEPTVWDLISLADASGACSPWAHPRATLVLNHHYSSLFLSYPPAACSNLISPAHRRADTEGECVNCVPLRGRGARDAERQQWRTARSHIRCESPLVRYLYVVIEGLCLWRTSLYRVRVLCVLCPDTGTLVGHSYMPSRVQAIHPEVMQGSQCLYGGHRRLKKCGNVSSRLPRPSPSRPPLPLPQILAPSPLHPLFHPPVRRVFALPRVVCTIAPLAPFTCVVCANCHRECHILY